MHENGSGGETRLASASTSLLLGEATSQTTGAAPEPMAEFAAHAVDAYVRARASLLAWVDALPTPIRRPRDLQLLTQLDYTLCWQIISVTKTEGLEGTAHLPDPVSLKRMIAESHRQKMSEEVISILQEGLQQYYDAAKAHADTRAGFGSMIAAVTTGDVVRLYFEVGA